MVTNEFGVSRSYIRHLSVNLSRLQNISFVTHQIMCIITQLEGSAQVFCGWHTAVAYVIPFDSPTTRMDSQTALLFLDLLRAQDRDKARTALLKLGVIRKEYAPVLPGPGRRIRLRKRYKGLR